jgi:hypothetical protein
MQILIASTKIRASITPPTNALTRNNRQKPYHLKEEEVRGSGLKNCTLE